MQNTTQWQLIKCTKHLPQLTICIKPVDFKICNPIKSPRKFWLVDCLIWWKLIVKLMWKSKGIWITKPTLSERSKLEDLHYQISRLTVKDTVTVCNWHKNIQIDQWKRIERLQEDRHTWNLDIWQNWFYRSIRKEETFE